MKAATKVSGIEANHIHPNSRYKEYFVSPPLLNIPITIRVLNALKANIIPIIKNIFVISGAKSLDTLNIFNNIWGGCKGISERGSGSKP